MERHLQRREEEQRGRRRNDISDAASGADDGKEDLQHDCSKQAACGCERANAARKDGSKHNHHCGDDRDVGARYVKRARRGHRRCADGRTQGERVRRRRNAHLRLALCVLNVHSRRGRGRADADAGGEREKRGEVQRADQVVGSKPGGDQRRRDAQIF